MSISNSNEPFAVFRPTRRALFTFFHLLLAGLGVFLLVLSGDMFADVYLRPGKNVPLLGQLNVFLLLLAGFSSLAFALPPLLLFRRIATTVYRDRIEIATVWRTRTLPLAEVRGAARQENSEQIDSIVLRLKRGGQTQDAAVQFASEAEQNAFIELIDRLVAERKSPPS